MIPSVHMVRFSIIFKTHDLSSRWSLFMHQMWDCSWHIIVKYACALLRDQWHSNRGLMPLKNGQNNSQKRWQVALHSWVHSQIVSSRNTRQFQGRGIPRCKTFPWLLVIRTANNDSHREILSRDGSWDSHWFTDVGQQDLFKLRYSRLCCYVDGFD